MNDVLNDVEHLYTTNIDKFGSVSTAVGWNTKDCHNLRFEKICAELPTDIEITIADLGCGYGALYEYAIKNNFKIQEYHGYDISQRMLEECKDYLSGDAKIKLFNSAELQYKCDYVVASGIFNNICSANKNAWFKYILKTLDNMDEYSNKGFIFNLLTNQVDFMRDDLFYADPTFFFNLCREKYSRKVSLYHNYDLWEWTIVVTK